MKEKDISELLQNIKSIEKMFNVSLETYKSIIKDVDSIWLRCPFNVEDRVVLTDTPVITKEKSWGWMGSKHFLIKGAKATVKERQFYDGSFVFGLIFDDETWIDYEGICQPVDRKALFFFRERWLSKDNYDQLTCEAL
jgi:hypothetical protein